MREWLIVDGYNVINNWNDFKKIRSENLEHARDLLREKIAEYVAFKGYLGLVVFDAQEVQGSSEEENYGAVTVIYTDEGETADSWIERKTYELNRNGDKVFVVTRLIYSAAALTAFRRVSSAKNTNAPKNR